MSRKPFITIDYQLPNEPRQEFIVMDVVPLDINHVSPAAALSNESYEYSGRHDQGQLPQLKTSGPMADVISAMQQAKKISDKFLTERINLFYGYGETQNIDQEDVEKEPPSGSDDENETTSKKQPHKQRQQNNKKAKQSKKDAKREESQAKRAKIEAAVESKQNEEAEMEVEEQS